MTLPSIASHARAHGITPQKRLGQNFIFDSSLCDKIVSKTPPIKGKEVLEIGPGPGGLTRSILSQNPAKLTVIEKDQRCLSLLYDLQKHYPNLHIISGDALEIEISEIAETKVTIISNLPYNIGTELVFKWLETPRLIESMTLMLQKEVVDRICAKESTKAYGKLSVMCQNLAAVSKEFDVSPKAFYPPPKVYSSIVRIIPNEQLLDESLIDKLRALAHKAFMQRRKMVKKALSPLPEGILLSVGINPQDRPEDITPDQYLALARIVE